MVAALMGQSPVLWMALVGVAVVAAGVACSGGSQASAATATASANEPAANTPAQGDSATSAPTFLVEEVPAIASPAAPTSEAQGPAAQANAAEAPTDAGPRVPVESVDTEDKRMYVRIDNKPVYIRNGGQVLLSEGIAAELYLDPYPPTTLRTFLDVYLTRDGVPMDDVSIGIEYDMLAMAHGPFWGEAEKLGGGHFLLTLDYIMYGAWDQTLEIRIGLKHIRLPVVIAAYP